MNSDSTKGRALWSGPRWLIWGVLGLATLVALSLLVGVLDESDQVNRPVASGAAIQVASERRGFAPDDLDQLLASEGYAARFETAYAGVIASRRFGIYENPRCELGDGGWRYRPQDAFAPFEDDIDWATQKRSDSNWAWHHHSLAIIDCHMTRYLASGESSHVASVRNVLQDWLRDNNGDAPADGKAWGDHTTALRLRAVIMLYAELRRAGALDTGFQRELVEFVGIHTDRLLRDPSVIRVRHNHALDQVFALALSRQFFPFIQYPGMDLRREVRARFQVERDHLIASDGVESENSPAYHMWVPTRIATMELTLDLLDEGEEDAAASRNDRSLEFATWIEAPNGLLPQIGDTAPGKRASIRLPGQSELPSFPEYVYANTEGEQGERPDGFFRLFPASGYLIYRDDWAPPLQDDTHVVLKCGFLADAHRHSDDGTITLSARGEEWLVDTGMFGYQAGPRRTHALSPKAHNVSYLDGATVISTKSRRYERYHTTWGLSDYREKAPKNAEVSCRSYQYPDAIYQRQVSIGAGGILLQDSFGFDGDPRTITTRFNIPYDKSVTLPSPGIARICSKKNDCIRIEFDPALVSEAKVIDGNGAKADAFRTRKYLKTEPVRVIELRWRTGTEAAAFDIRL